MADADFDIFTDLAAMLGTDSFLFTRSGAGYNATLATLMRNLPDGTAGAPGLAFAADQNSGLCRPGADMIGLVTGGVERLRVDASGNVGIGTASPSAKVDVTTLAGRIFVTDNGSRNMLSSVDINNSAHIDLEIRASNIILSGGGAPRWYVTTAGHLYSWADNAYSLGGPANRASVVYAGTGAINTSDERDKLWTGFREDRRAVWRRITRAIFADLGWYQWRDAVEAKGEDGARWHFGARAQRVWAIVAGEGLAPPLIGAGAAQRPDPDWQGPPPPAFLCFDAWEAETEQRPLLSPSIMDADGKPIVAGVETVVMREAGNRFGLRVDQLGLLLDWSLHERLSLLEAA